MWSYEMNWFTVRVLSGKEKKIRDTMMSAIDVGADSGKIDEVLVPSENVVEMKSGKKVVKDRVFYPGYVLVKMDMDNESRHYVENIPGVMSFVGPNGEPEALQSEEVNRILGEVEVKDGQEVMATRFQKNDGVKIVDGPFLDFEGSITAPENEKPSIVPFYRH